MSANTEPKLTEADAERMIQMRRAGLTFDEIARVYSVTAGTVYATLRTRMPAEELGGIPVPERAVTEAQQASAAPEAAEPKPPETTSERYLREIRNYVVAAFTIWIVLMVAGGIAWIAIAAHAHAVAQNNACAAQGGVMVGGQCD